MKVRLPIIIILFSLIMMSCSKTPRHVISESDMVELLVDIHKAEAYIDLNGSQFAQDSIRKVFKQSVFMRHGVTAEEYDTSIVWYSKNMDVFTGVYDRVQKQLEEDKTELELASGKVVVTSRKKGGRAYKDYGDTADIWKETRQLAITSNMKFNVLPFSQHANNEILNGDKFTLNIKLVNSRALVNALVAVEYSDGSYTYVERRIASEGWNNVTVQADSLKKIDNIFGYLRFRALDDDIAYIDSVMLLRTHLDRNSYGVISSQKLIDKNKKANQQNLLDSKEESNKPKEIEQVLEVPTNEVNVSIKDDRRRGPRQPLKNDNGVKTAKMSAKLSEPISKNR